MKKLLVVSDNPPLTTFFKEECARQRLTDTVSIDYRYSAVNKNPGGMVALQASAVNVKDPAFVAFARETYDLVFSLHCKQIFPAALVQGVTCVNLHPGLNPHNRGWYPRVFSIINGKPVGATLHLMDEDVDHGAIIGQRPITIRSSDTSLDVYNRVVDAEKELLSEHLRSLVEGRFTASPALDEGNYNSIEDFKALCALQLDAQGTLRSHLDLLRALSHGNFKNGFFIDESGKKIFVRLSLEEEC